MNKKVLKDLKAFRFKRFSRKAYGAFNSMHRVVNIGVVSGCMLTFAHATTSAQTQLVSEQVKEIAEEELEEVTVTASRVELNVNQAARLVTVITKQEIEQSPVRSIQDLLNYAANIDVLQRGGHGVQADISIRGGSFDQTAILLNGINLSSPHTGHYSFDIPINLSDIERIEIIHGPSSMTYGASAFSGGINIITKKKADAKAYARLEAGGHNLYSVEAKGALQNKIITSQLSAGYSTSEGYVRNSDYDIVNLLWQTRLNVEQSKIDVQLGFNDKKYGANTFYTAAYPNQYDKVRTYLASVSGETGEKLKFIPKIYWTRHNDCFQLVRGDNSQIPFNYHKSDVYGANLNIQYSSVIGITSLGGELRNEGIQSTVLGKPVENPKDKYIYSDSRTNVSFALEHNLLFKQFTLSLGLLANYNTALKGDYKFYPAINASYRILDNLKVYTSWNKAMRMPTFTDLYYNTKTHNGNANLKHESSESIELGFKYSNSFIKAGITGYYMEGDNLIDWIKYNPDEKWQSVNLAKVYKTGIETDVTLYLHQITPFFKYNTTIRLSYAHLHQNGKDASGEKDSNYILNYLRDKFVAQLNIPIYKDISLNGIFRWQDREGGFTKYENNKPAYYKSYNPFCIFDVKINWKYKDFLFNLNANNVFDTKYYDLGNIPQAGFWFTGGVSYTLR